MIDHKRILLNTFSDHRWFLMTQLADLAEETGDQEELDGWRWLIKNEKFPYQSWWGEYIWRYTKAPAKRYFCTLKNSLQPYMLHSGNNIEIGDFLLKSAKAIGKAIKDGVIRKAS